MDSILLFLRINVIIAGENNDLTVRLYTDLKTFLKKIFYELNFNVC